MHGAPRGEPVSTDHFDTRTHTHLQSNHHHPPRIFFSAEGIEMVFAAWLGGATGAPANLLSLSTSWSSSSSNVNYAIFYRPSTLSSPGPVPISDWWGYNSNGQPGNYIGTATGSDQLSSSQWFLLEGSWESWASGSQVGGPLGWLTCRCLRAAVPKDPYD